MDQGLRNHRSLLDLFEARVRHSPGEVALLNRRGEGQVATTWAEWHRRSRTLAAALVASGMEARDRVVVLANTRLEWALFDVAILMAGGITVPIFPTETASSCAQLIRDCGARWVVTDAEAQTDKLWAVEDQLTDLRGLVVIDGPVQGSEGGLGAKTVGLDAFLEAGERALGEVGRVIDERIAAIRTDDCASITYTPGTQDVQKGVMLTHGNMGSAAMALAEVLPVGEDDLQLLYLPLAQAYARTSLAVAVARGATTAFARSHKTVLEDCVIFQPTWLCGVPRLFERIKAQILAERRNMPGVQRVALEGALRLTEATRPSGEDAPTGLSGLPRNLAQQLLHGPMREIVGDRLRFAISGGSPLHCDTGEFFRQHGVEVLEGYGMTETCAASHINRLDDNELGSVGHPVPGLAWRLEEDGELLLRGPNITPGYWQRHDETERAIDAEGWFHTGDLAVADESGRLTITDRKRDVIVTANGKAIAPQPMEDGLRRDPLVAQALVHGEGRNFLTALIALDEEVLMAFAKDRGLEGDYAALTRDRTVYGAVEAIVEQLNGTLASHAVIRKFAILSSGLTSEQGELTPTQRLRRRAAMEKHSALIDSFYSETY